MENKKLTEEFIYKCEKQRKKNEKKLKPLTRDDIMKRDGRALLLRKQEELAESLHHAKNN